jgi:esterase
MKLFFRKYGEGSPLVILHGLYGSSDNWVTIARKLAANCCVILPDLRNHGASPHDEKHDYPSMSNDLHELLVFSGISDISLAGHSMGGKTAMMFASEHPEMINNLLIADVSPFSDNRRKSAGRFENSAILKAMSGCDLNSHSSRNEVEEQIAQKIGSERIRALIMKNLQRRPDNTFEWKINIEALTSNLESILDGVPFRNESLPVTGFPVTFLKGGKSDYIRDGEINEIRKIFPAAELTVIENAGHWIQADSPESVTAALLELVGK